MMAQIQRQKRSRLMLSLFLIIFIDTFCWFIFAPILLKLCLPGSLSILPNYTTISARYFLYGLTMSLPPLAFIIVSPIVGIASDILGRKKVLLYCLAASFLGFIFPIYGIVKHAFVWILIGRLIGGASTASQPVAQAAVSDYADNLKDKGIYLSLIAFAMTLGLLLGPLAGSYLSDPNILHWFSIKTPLYVGAILTSLNFLLLIYGYSPADVLKKSCSNSHYLIRELLVKLRNNRLILLLFVFFLVEFSWSLYYQSVYLVLPILFQYTVEKVAVFTAYAGTCMCIGLSVIYPLSVKYMSIERIAIISLCGMMLGLFGCQIATTSVFLILSVTFVAIFTGISYVSLLAILSECLDEHHQGYILGIGGTTLALAWFITGNLSGFLVNIATFLPVTIALASIFIAALIAWKSFQKTQLKHEFYETNG